MKLHCISIQSSPASFRDVMITWYSVIGSYRTYQQRTETTEIFSWAHLIITLNQSSKIRLWNDVIFTLIISKLSLYNLDHMLLSNEYIFFVKTKCAITRITSCRALQISTPIGICRSAGVTRLISYAQIGPNTISVEINKDSQSYSWYYQAA